MAFIRVGFALSEVADRGVVDVPPGLIAQIPAIAAALAVIGGIFTALNLQVSSIGTIIATGDLVRDNAFVLFILASLLCSIGLLIKNATDPSIHFIKKFSFRKYPVLFFVLTALILLCVVTAFAFKQFRAPMTVVHIYEEGFGQNEPIRDVIDSSNRGLPTDSKIQFDPTPVVGADELQREFRRAIEQSADFIVLSVSDVTPFAQLGLNPRPFGENSIIIFRSPLSPAVLGQRDNIVSTWPSLESLISRAIVSSNENARGALEVIVPPSRYGEVASIAKNIAGSRDINISASKASGNPTGDVPFALRVGGEAKSASAYPVRKADMNGGALDALIFQRLLDAHISLQRPIKPNLTIRQGRESMRMTDNLRLSAEGDVLYPTLTVSFDTDGRR